MSTVDFAYRVVITIPARSNLPQDNFQNTFHFWRSAEPTSTNWTALRDNVIKPFYNSTPTGGSGAVGSYFSFAAVASATQIEAYQLPTSPGDTGSPVYSSLFSFAIGGTSTNSHIPQEVAACLTFAADMTDVAVEESGTRPQQSHRNRVYLGPLSDGASVVNSTTGVPTPSSALQTDATLAAKQYLGAAGVTAGWIHMAFSRKLWAQFPIVTASMDNAFDTQRRRGQAPTARVTATY